MREINRVVMKKDALQLMTGKPAYTEDLAPEGCLIVKALRSPHARAIVRHVDTKAALTVPGIECILTAEDVPKTRFTIAGQTYPELSPYDRLILDRQIRYVGDPVALVAGRDAACVDKAMRMIKVEYDIQEPLLDFRQAVDNPIVVHPEDDWNPRVPVGGDNRRNIIAQAEEDWGDVDTAFQKSDVVIDRIYHTNKYSSL